MRPSGPVRAVLERELAKAQRLGPHKNVAGVVAVIREGDQLLVAQEWPDGHTLREVIDAQRKQGTTIDAARAHTLLGHVATGLEHAYAQLVHGGLHPGNIWLTSSGRVRIADLALLPALSGAGAGRRARRDARRAVPGARGGPWGRGHAGLGRVCPGGDPVRAADAAPRRSRRCGRRRRRSPRCPPAVDAVVGRALLPNPAGRYPAPSELMKALEAAVASAPRPAAPAPSSEAASGASAPQAGTAAAATAGRPFDVSAAAGLSQEEARWLVQKDRLDFGPFSLQQVKAQIEQGVFRGDNLIVDMDSGSRQKIMDHPQLGDFARSSERRLEHARRVQAEHVHEKVERKQYKAFVLIIGAAVLVVAVGLGIWLKNRGAAREGELASRVGESDIDEFLKGVKVDFPSSKRPAARRGGRASGKGGDPFNTTTNLGDVSSGRRGRHPQRPGHPERDDEQLPQARPLHHGRAPPQPWSQRHGPGVHRHGQRQGLGREGERPATGPVRQLRPRPDAVVQLPEVRRLADDRLLVDGGEIAADCPHPYLPADHAEVRSVQATRDAIG